MRHCTLFLLTRVLRLEQAFALLYRHEFSDGTVSNSRAFKGLAKYVDPNPTPCKWAASSGTTTIVCSHPPVYGTVCIGTVRHGNFSKHLWSWHRSAAPRFERCKSFSQCSAIS